MRVAVLSDIHGNWRALEAVLDDLDRQGVDEILSLGDTIGYGPEPAEVVRALRARGVISVMGNHELALVSRSYAARLQGAARDSLRLTRDLLDSDALGWLAGLPAWLVHRGARLVHGCPPESMTVYLFSPTPNRLQRLFASYPEQRCFAGHTHTLELFTEQDGQVVRERLVAGALELDPRGRALVLAGSVGQPRDHLGRQAKYLLWDPETDRIEVRAVDYDVQATVRLLHERGFPAVNARRLGG